MTLENILVIEVYNTSTRYIGKELNMYCWDDCLNAGKEYTAIAVDDIHKPCDFACGWIMICPESNTPEDIIKALKQGYFYSSQGPEFSRISVYEGIVEAEFTPCAAAVFVGRNSTGRCLAIERPEGPGTSCEITSIKTELKDCPRGLFRIQLRDAQGNYAWSNPIRNTYL
ncbi:MAG: hypothetical protein IKB25_00080 [Lentisphaeria bacterium]|nr:hypothetical protein [Lentisphaeria bacterium]